MTPFFSRSVAANLVPMGDVELIGRRDGLWHWRFTGNDPRFFLDLPGPLAPGLYRLELIDSSATDGLSRPLLYASYDSDFNEEDTLPLHFVPDGQTAFVEFPRQVNHLRFDPSTKPGTLTLRCMKITRISTTLHRASILAHAARDRMQSPEAVVSIMRKSYNVLRRDGVVGLKQAVGRWLARGTLDLVSGDYDEWVQRYDTFSPDDISQMQATAARVERQPLISVLMPVFNTPENLLREAIDSVRSQVYENWQLCIADDCSTKPAVRRVLDEYREMDARIEVVYRPKNGHICEASNSALERVRGEWFALLDHDDLLRPNALLEAVLEIASHPNAGLIYSDEDKIDNAGRRYDPFFKPDFSLELLRSQNYFNHLTLHRTALVRRAGGWRKGFEGSQDYDLNLRIIEQLQPEQIRHIPKILYHWRAAAGSTAAAGSEKNYAYTAGLRALRDHASRTGSGATVEKVRGLPFYRYRHPVPVEQPLVSLIIPTRDRFALISGCVNSILEKSTYNNYEIVIVDNGSTDSDTLEYFASLKGNPKARVIAYNKPFNYSAINNFAVTRCKGELIGLINNDIEVISPDWLSEMVSFAAQPDIGCVGAKLYYANDTIQHAGVICGLGGVAGHSHKHSPRDSHGYFYRLRIAHELSAVTAACLVVRKSIFEQVAGLDADNLRVAFNDVDFCLAVRSLGYRNVWTPHAELYHLESVSRGPEDDPEKIRRFNREANHMKEKWGPLLAKDPYYSPNLTLEREDYSLAFPPRVPRLPALKQKQPTAPQRDGIAELAIAIEPHGS